MTKETTDKKPKVGSRIQMEDVPTEEREVKVIDMKLGELFLGVLACATLAGVGFTYYTHVKARSEERRIRAIAGAISKVTSEVMRIMPSGQGNGGNEIEITSIPGSGSKKKGEIAQA